MELTTYLSSTDAPSAADFARTLGTAPSVISQWRTGARPVPIKSCVAIERATAGAVTRRDLRDDWRDVWPELADWTMRCRLPATLSAIRVLGVGIHGCRSEAGATFNKFEINRS